MNEGKTSDRREPDFRTIIVGAGAAGLYTAYRLSEDPRFHGNTAVLEGAARIGGRVMSVADEHIKNDSPTLYHELGAMRYMDHNAIVCTLISRFFPKTLTRNITIRKPSSTYADEKFATNPGI